MRSSCRAALPKTRWFTFGDGSQLQLSRQHVNRRLCSSDRRLGTQPRHDIEVPVVARRWIGVDDERPRESRRRSAARSAAAPRRWCRPAVDTHARPIAPGLAAKRRCQYRCVRITTSSRDGRNSSGQESTTEDRAHAEGRQPIRRDQRPVRLVSPPRRRRPGTPISIIGTDAARRAASASLTPPKSASAMLSVGLADERPHTFTSRSGWAYGSGRKTMASATVNVVVVTPIPTPSVSTAAMVNPGLRRSYSKAVDNIAGENPRASSPPLSGAARRHDVCHARDAGKGRLKGWLQSAKPSAVRMWDVAVRRRTGAATDGPARRHCISFYRGSKSGSGQERSRYGSSAGRSGSTRTSFCRARWGSSSARSRRRLGPQ